MPTDGILLVLIAISSNKSQVDLESNILKILYVYAFWVPQSAFIFHREPRQGFERLGLNITSQGKTCATNDISRRQLQLLLAVNTTYLAAVVVMPSP